VNIEFFSYYYIHRFLYTRNEFIFIFTAYLELCYKTNYLQLWYFLKEKRSIQMICLLLLSSYFILLMMIMIITDRRTICRALFSLILFRKKLPLNTILDITWLLIHHINTKRYILGICDPTKGCKTYQICLDFFASYEHLLRFVLERFCFIFTKVYLRDKEDNNKNRYFGFIIRCMSNRYVVWEFFYRWQ